jgi:hypothetical protein
MQKILRQADICVQIGVKMLISHSVEVARVSLVLCTTLTKPVDETKV